MSTNALWKRLAFDGNLSFRIVAWKSTQCGAQCANNGKQVGMDAAFIYSHCGIPVVVKFGYCDFYSNAAEYEMKHLSSL